jgi:hypothetical protein
MKIGMAKNEIGEGESVYLWAEGKIVFLLPDTMRTQCKRKPVYQTGPKLTMKSLNNIMTKSLFGIAFDK